MDKLVKKVGNAYLQFVQKKRQFFDLKQLEKDYQAVLKHKNHLVSYLDGKGVVKEPDQIMHALRNHLRYFSLHLQEATGLQQLIGTNMMQEVMDQLHGNSF